MTESEHGIFNAILRGHVDFTSDPWPSISPGAKDIVKKMLTVDPKQRLTAFQVLSKYYYNYILRGIIVMNEHFEGIDHITIRYYKSAA